MNKRHGRFKASSSRDRFRTGGITYQAQALPSSTVHPPGTATGNPRRHNVRDYLKASLASMSSWNVDQASPSAYISPQPQRTRAWVAISSMSILSIWVCLSRTKCSWIMRLERDDNEYQPMKHPRRHAQYSSLHSARRSAQRHAAKATRPSRPSQASPPRHPLPNHLILSGRAVPQSLSVHGP